MNTRDARRWVRRELAEHARHLQRDPGVTGDPDDRARKQEAAAWAADYLASPLPRNLQALVTPAGTPPAGVDPATWRTPDAEPDPRPAGPHDNGQRPGDPGSQPG